MFFAGQAALLLALVSSKPALGTRNVRAQLSAKDIPSSRQNTRSTFSLTDLYQGQNLINSFTFWSNASGSDPTHGMVNYLSESDATSRGLVKVNSDNSVTLAVDSHTTLTEGENRDSIRITSQKTFTGGLFIADFQAVPYGCAVWPAWWSFGPNWPNNGEIDVLEGVNQNTVNQMTLHSGTDCSLDSSAAMTGHVISTDCDSTQNDDGCSVQDTNTNSYGAGFNSAGGGVFAHLWDDSGIKIWHFARSSVPSDITSKSPNPSSWPEPQAFFDNTDCDISSHFSDHSLVLNIDLCGDWAGSVYSSSGCPGTCASQVANPSNFANAFFKVNYIAVYND